MNDKAHALQIVLDENILIRIDNTQFSLKYQQTGVYYITLINFIVK